MSVITDVVINDQAAVAHTFTPDFASKGVAQWRNRAGGVPVGFGVLTVSDNGLSAKGPIDKVSLKLRVPEVHVDAETGVTVLDYYTEVNATFNLPRSSSSTVRNNVRAMFRNLLSDPAVADAISTREPIQ